MCGSAATWTERIAPLDGGGAIRRQRALAALLADAHVASPPPGAAQETVRVAAAGAQSLVRYLEIADGKQRTDQSQRRSVPSPHAPPPGRG